jgi:hypothetical protein
MLELSCLICGLSGGEMWRKTRGLSSEGEHHQILTIFVDLAFAMLS